MKYLCVLLFPLCSKVGSFFNPPKNCCAQGSETARRHAVRQYRRKLFIVMAIAMVLATACENFFVIEILPKYSKDGGNGKTSAYTVSFNSRGGTPVSPLKNITGGSTISRPLIPAKDQFMFEAWYKEASLSNEWDFDEDTVTSNITLYAGWELSGGQGDGNSELSPLFVYDERTLKRVGSEPGGHWDLDKYYKQIEDITLLDPQTPASGNWTAIGNGTSPFTGDYNGNGKTITNLIIYDNLSDPENFEAKYHGLFGSIRNGGSVHDLTLEDFSFTSVGWGYVGGIAGDVANGSITNCDVKGSIYAEGTVGGITGQNLGLVEDCNADVIVVSDSTAGGITGWNGSIVRNSRVKGSISGESTIGGIVGVNHTSAYINAYVQDSSFSGTVSGDRAIGGIAGQSTGTIENCSSSGTVTGNNSSGGIVGENHGPVRFCFAEGSVSGNINTGGIAGYHYAGSGIIEKCYSLASVSGVSHTGGIAGNNSKIIQDCYVIGPVSGEYYAGGIAGSNQDTILRCYALGDVEGINGAGGIVGYSISGSLNYCAALNQNVSVSNNSVARIVDSFSTLIANNFGRTDMNMTLKGVYRKPTSGSKQDGTNVDSGDAANQYNNQAFWDASSPGGLNWDFANIWEWGSGLPVLRGKS